MDKNLSFSMRDFNIYKDITNIYIYDTYEMKNDPIYKKYIKLVKRITYLREKIYIFSQDGKFKFINKFKKLVVCYLNLILNICYEDKKNIDKEMQIFINWRK